MLAFLAVILVLSGGTAVFFRYRTLKKMKQAATSGRDGVDYTYTGEVSGDDVEKAVSFFKMARIFQQKGEYEKAEQYYRQVIALSTSGDITLRAYTNLGVVYDNLKKFDTAREFYTKALAINPEDPEILYNIALNYQSAGDNDNALNYMMKASGLNRNNYAIRLAAGNLFYKMNLFREAEAEYAEALKLRPGSPEPLVFLGSARLELGKTGEAAANFLEVLKNPSSDEQVSLAASSLGSIYDDAGRFREAAEYYTRALRVSPSDSLINYNLGVAYLHNGTYREAVTYFRRALEIDPEISEGLMNLAGAYYYSGDMENALKYYQLFNKKEPGNSEVNRMIAHILEKTGRQSDAVKNYKDMLATAKSPEELKMAFAGLGNIYFDRGQYEDAIKHYTKGLQYDKNDTSLMFNIALSQKRRKDYQGALATLAGADRVQVGNVEIYRETGDIYFKTGNYDKALEYLDKVLMIKKNDPEALYLSGYIHQLKGNANIALTRYRDIIQTAKDSGYIASVYNNMANIYSDRADYPNAVNMYKRALEYLPGNRDVLLNLGLTYKNSKAYESAVKVFETLLKSESDNPVIFNELGNIYYDRNDYKKAVYFYEKAIKLDSSSVEAFYNLKKAKEKL